MGLQMNVQRIERVIDALGRVRLGLTAQLSNHLPKFGRRQAGIAGPSLNPIHGSNLDEAAPAFHHFNRLAEIEGRHDSGVGLQFGPQAGAVSRRVSDLALPDFRL